MTVRDTFLIVFGCFLFAVGADCFEIPNGLAAGGVTGLATVVHAVTGLPVGLMSIAMNVVLILLVVRQGDRHYLVRTAGGIVALASGRFSLGQIAIPVGVGVGAGTGIPIVTSTVTATI